MGIDAQTALPILLSKHVFKESATMRSLIDNVNAKLRQFKDWYHKEGTRVEGLARTGIAEGTRQRTLA